jgi:hypothetical protein
VTAETFPRWLATGNRRVRSSADSSRTDEFQQWVRRRLTPTTRTTIDGWRLAEMTSRPTAAKPEVLAIKASSSRGAGSGADLAAHWLARVQW